MGEISGRTTSVWMATEPLQSRPPLQEHTSADVCVVGAGIAGLTTAYLLARRGRSVVVIDDGPVAGGETSRTTAHLVTALDDRYLELERLHGERGARLAAESHAAAIDTIEQVCRDEAIACDLERLDGYLFVPPGEKTDLLAREHEAARRSGVAVERVARAPLDGYDTGPALRFPDQAQFHPLKYLAGLVRAIERDGGRIHTGTRARDFEGGSDAHVTTAAGHTISARAVVVATNVPVNDRLVIHVKQQAYRTYVVALLVPPGGAPRALLWDTADPYHYVRRQGLGDGRELLIVGGEDHRTGQADDADERYARLEAWTRERFPAARAVEHRWSGQILEPDDSLAFIGRNPGDENVFVATGDSGNGITHGTIAGLLLTDLIVGRESPWATLYDPGRKTLRAAGEYLRGNVESSLPYGQWVTPGEVDGLDEVPAGEGRIVRRGLRKLAAYRDPSGSLTVLSAVCRHLGCIVEWNSSERTWDCPCHGSRYTAEGRVINGPANSDLPPADGGDGE